MSSIAEAREVLEKIKNSIVYTRAKDYHSALMEIYRKANKSDASIIRELVKEANAFMDVMEKKETDL